MPKATRAPEASASPASGAESSASSAPGANFTPQIRRFCDLYLAGGESNGAQAARDAGYSAKRAAQQASALLARPDVAAYLESKRAPVVRELARKHKITLERILEENAAIALVDFTELVQEEELDLGKKRGKIRVLRTKPLAELDPVARRAIKGIHGKTGLPMLFDKGDALNRLAELIDAKPSEREPLTLKERAQMLAEIIANGQKRKAAGAKPVPATP